MALCVRCPIFIKKILLVLRESLLNVILAKDANDKRLQLSMDTYNNRDRSASEFWLRVS